MLNKLNHSEKDGLKLLPEKAKIDPRKLCDYLMIYPLFSRVILLQDIDEENQIAGDMGTVDIKSLSVKGNGHDITIDQAEVSWAGLVARIGGQVQTGNDGIALDLDIASGEVVWNEIKKHLPEKLKGRKYL